MDGWRATGVLEEIERYGKYSSGLRKVFHVAPAINPL